MDSEFRILRAKTTKVRREEIDGDEFLVVPMVALRTGVYQCANCDEPEFYDANVFARIPDSWNDRPATLGHPMREGVFVSAGSDDVWRNEGLGRIRNARKSGDKLVLEAWVDLTKADEVGEAATALVDALEDGEGVDVSVGAFVDTVDRPGTFQGNSYARTQLGYVPDHVAFLPGQTGACSWADGCGAPRVNQQIEANLMTLQTGGVLPTDSQGQLVGERAGESILPLKAGEGQLGLKLTGACPCGGKDGECQCDEAEKAEILASSLAFKDNAMGDMARRRILDEAVRQKLGTDTWSSVVEIFEDTVIYQTSGGTFSRDFTISEDGTVSLSDDAVQGALVAEFMPITVQQENTEMTERKEAVDGLIANEAAPWSEDDREFLMGAGDEQFAKLTPNEEKGAKAGDGTGDGNDDGAAAAAEPSADGDAAGEGAAPTANAEWMNNVPDNVREILNEGLAERDRVRADMIGTIEAASANAFSDKDLDGMSNDQLRKLAALASSEASPKANGGNDAVSRLANYGGQMPAPSSGSGDSGYMPMPAGADYSKPN